MNVFTVEDYELSDGKKRQTWIKIGTAFPHKDGVGFNIDLRAFPRDGRLVVLPRREDKPDTEAPAPTGNPFAEQSSTLPDR
jgi:hypothetical protein